MDNKELEVILKDLEEKVLDLGRSLWHWKVRRRKKEARIKGESKWFLEWCNRG